jgi:hypothetical protein
MLLSISNCPLIWENMASSSLTLALQMAATKPLYLQVTPFLPYNIADAAAIIIDNETGDGCSSIGAWDAETKTCTLTVDLARSKQLELMKLHFTEMVIL